MSLYYLLNLGQAYLASASSLPEPTCRTVDAFRPLADLAIGELRGFAPWAALIAAFVLGLLLLVVAPAEGPRRRVLRALGFLLIIAAVAVAAINLFPVLISSPCGL